MAITPSFSISQSALNPALVVATDTSTGSDGAIVSRKIFVQKADGTYLIPAGVTTDFTVWPYADASITLDILSVDIGAVITVQWLDVSNAVLYTLTQEYPLAEFNKSFFYYLIQQQALTPGIIQDANYFSNLAVYWMNITGGIQAIEIGADVAAAQNCFDRATYMMQNQSKFF
jgi:hypothetical protein